MGNRASNMRYMKGVQQIPSAGAKGTRTRIEIELKLLADIGMQISPFIPRNISLVRFGWVSKRWQIQSSQRRL
jgi:hypothetical protein